MLKTLLARAGVSCIVVPPVKAGDETVSSTLIRRKLTEGDIEGASFLLGRRYSFLLPVIHGRRLGRTIGFPTINQRFPDYQVVPAYGVYACLCEVDGQTYRGISNIGVRRPSLSMRMRRSAKRISLTSPRICTTRRRAFTSAAASGPNDVSSRSRRCASR